MLDGSPGGAPRGEPARVEADVVEALGRQPGGGRRCELTAGAAAVDDGVSSPVQHLRRLDVRREDQGALDGAGLVVAAHAQQLQVRTATQLRVEFGSVDDVHAWAPVVWCSVVWAQRASVHLRATYAGLLPALLPATERPLGYRRTMDLRVLGHLRVDDGDRTVAVSPGKATELLLRLLADAGRPVAVDALVEAMWPTSPPREARAALQVKVSQLRRVLEPVLDRPADSSVIVSEGDAYLVPADGPHVIDAHRFAELVEDARRLVRDDRTDEAVDLLGEALGLWAGEVPFVESGAPWAAEARAALVELRQQAREERAALVLETGGALAPIVADLERLCAEEPLRDRSHELLMWALYRVGRQVEALTVHDALRRRLVDELGIDPNPALQDLQLRVLAQDPRLDAPVPPPAPPPLPAPLTGFVDGGGRIERSRQLLGAARLVTLIGFGGTGKTRLALETAKRTDDAVVWFADLTTVTRSTDVAQTVATALGATPDAPNPLAPPPDDAQQALARIAARVADRPALLVLDNCEHVLDGAAEVARQVLADCPGLRVLATSRQVLGIPGEAVWSLPPLGVPPPDVVGPDLLGYPAIELLLDRLRLRDPSTAHADAPELLAEIARRLDGIPLALELVAARAGALSLAAIVRRLDDHLALSTDARGMPERHRTLTAVVDWS